MRTSALDVFVWAALQLGAAYAQSVDPPTSNFVRRADDQIAVLGDYLYVVGGGVSSRDDASNNTKKADVKFMDVSLGLSIQEDWSAEDVRFKQTDTKNKLPLGVFGHSLWVNKDDNELVVWGGQDQHNETPERKLWTFKPDGKGGGDWEGKDMDRDITIPTRGSAVTCGRSGWTAGGLTNNRTDGNFGSENIAVPGLMEYNLDTKTWTNHSGAGLGNLQTHERGAAVCVEIPERDPMVAVMGGGELTLTNANDQTATFNDFTNLQLWGIKQEQWYKQETYGERPRPRMGHCSVGVPGPNGTYEIFMHGGFKEGGVVLDEIWTLSLPAFRWFKAPTKVPRGRYMHGCTRIGSQMVVVGGNRGRVWQEKDGLPNGIGILDLNTLTWKNKFDADSDAYRGPEKVRAWYDERGYDTASWTDDTVRSFFLNSEGNPPGESADPGSAMDEDQDETSDDSEDDDKAGGDKSASTPVAAIAGGAVGGIAGIGLAGALAWCFWRRRNRAAAESRAPTELYGDNTRAELPPKHDWKEEAKIPRSELGSDDPHAVSSEMPGDQERKPVELP